MKVGDLMTTDVVTTTPGTTIVELEQLFTRNAISGAPVLDGDQLVGVVSQTDIIGVIADQPRLGGELPSFLLSPQPIAAPILAELAAERAAAAERMAARTVADVMTGVPVTVAASDDVAVAAEKMCNERIHRVLVTEDGRLVGLLSALDLVGLLIDMD